MEQLKEFPARHISSEEDLRVLLNEYFDKTISYDEYNHLLGKLEDAEDQYIGARAEVEELTELLEDSKRQNDECIKQINGLQEIIDIQAKELEELRQQNHQEEDKPKLKRLNKKPLKRLK